MWLLQEELSALSYRVHDMITESHAPSNSHLYTLKWGVFMKWCCDEDIDLVHFPVSDVLHFLQHRVDNGSLPSTLKDYIFCFVSFPG